MTSRPMKPGAMWKTLFEKGLIQEADRHDLRRIANRWRIMETTPQVTFRQMQGRDPNE